MAGSYAPTITVSPTPLIAVTTSDLTTYDEIQETQGTINYEAQSLYFQANSIEQVNEPIDIEIYDANGELDKTKRINVADPTQFQPVKDIDFKNDPLIFNGRTRLNLNLLPNENIKLYLEEGQSWLRSKYGFNSRWSMQQYVKSFYDLFFEYYPEYKKFKI